MEYEVHTEQVEPQVIAAVRRKCSQGELSSVIPTACGVVWDYAKEAGLANPGRLVALYHDCVINLEVGVEVGAPFAGSDEVSCSGLPGGLVATTMHLGPYDRLGEAHEALHRWCREEGHSLTGPSWEVYGHWDDDPERLRTDLFYRLKEPG